MFATALLALAAQATPSDWVIPAGSTVYYDTTLGSVRINSLTVEPGALLRIIGPKPFLVMADSHVIVDGMIDASGLHAKSVGTLFTPNQPEPGAAGSAGGGPGGVGSPLTTASSPKGGDGFAPHYGALLNRGGRGGEAGYSQSSDKQFRRGAGGGGGAFGPDEVGGGVGLIAEPGGDGHAQGIGALTGTSPPKGGAVNARPFQDANADNDFWGRKLVSSTGVILQGELQAPSMGVGGGAGGDSIQSSAFPTIPFGPPFKDKKGAGAGGGGGLVVLLSPKITLGSSGSILANGGNGATGENVLGFDHIAGSSGGGSGGMIILEADMIDMGLASADALSARGGEGGIGKSSSEPLSKGGNGGPGLIQLHVPNAGDVLLPAAVSLEDISAPNAHILLPELL